MIEFSINGQHVTANKGDTILQAARKAGFYIPTMCYLEKTTSVASCRLCVVDIKDVKGQILSCQTPAAQGIEVFTNSPNLYKSRQNIMKLYNVNHPLECGVCDKSGECELQNKTLEFGVTAQDFSAKDQKRDIQNWGLINYDPSLCIVCEKCTHVCNEVIGDDAIDIKYGGYSSSVIVKGDNSTLDCTFCGECIAVCPVGALISNDFKYRANAWELKSIPSTCAHCSAGCALNYEVKHTAINNSSEQIYRVTNHFEYTTLCGAGRFGFDFDTKEVKNSPELFNQAVEALKDAHSIHFSSMITNEEALVLQHLKEQKGVKLINSDAKAFQDFLHAFSSTSGHSLYSGTLEDIASSDQVIVLGTRIATDNPQVRYHLTMASKRNKAHVVYMHTMEDTLLQNVVTQFSKYEVGTEEGVMAMLAKTLVDDASMQDYFSALDEGYLCAETNVGNEEFEAIAKQKIRAKKTTIVLGEDLYTHENALNIAKLAGVIARLSDVHVAMVPKMVNTLGVALICDLDEASSGKTFGYNAQADFIVGATNEAHLSMPALNQQEGTITSLDKKVLPINVAVSHEGYELLDIVRKVIPVNEEHVIDMTPSLPLNKGFKKVHFDDLKNSISLNGVDMRGYDLEILACPTNGVPSEVEELPEYNGTVVYACNEVLQFNAFTARSKLLARKAYLVGSPQFATAAKINDNDTVTIEYDTHSVSRTFVVDSALKGTVALQSTFDQGLESLENSYRYKKVNISKR